MQTQPQPTITLAAALALYDICPRCSVFDPVYYPAEDGEPAILTCPECGWEIDVDDQSTPGGAPTDD